MLKTLLNHIVPPRCLSCQTHVPEQGTLCSSCWPKIPWISAPYCRCCGRPFGYLEARDGVDGLLCLDCVQSAPPFIKGRSVFLYDEQSKPLILAFKHGDRTDYAKPFAQWIVRAAADILAQSDVIVPVPLHWRRLSMRRYNQAGLLALEMGRLAGLAVDVLSLMRVRPTSPQGKQGRQARYQRGASINWSVDQCCWWMM